MIGDRSQDIHFLDPDCWCDACEKEFAEVKAERRKREQEAMARRARSRAVREFDEQHFPEQVKEDNEMAGLAFRAAYAPGSMSPEQSQRLDDLTKKRRARKVN